LFVDFRTSDQTALTVQQIGTFIWNTNCLISFHKEPIFFSILGILSETVSSLHIWFNLQFETFLILFYKKKEENVQELNFNVVTLIAFEFHTCTYYLLSEQCTRSFQVLYKKCPSWIMLETFENSSFPSSHVVFCNSLVYLLPGRMLNLLIRRITLRNVASHNV